MILGCAEGRSNTTDLGVSDETVGSSRFLNGGWTDCRTTAQRTASSGYR